MMKRLFLLLLFSIFLFVLSIKAQIKTIIRFDNPLEKQRSEVVLITWSDIKTAFPEIDSSKLVVIDLYTMQQVAYQLETKGGHQIQNLLLYVTIPASSYREYELKTGEPSAFPSKTYCCYVPERKDDFAWENDRIAHRMYGKALEGTSENAYGIDVWAKKVDYLIIDKWYALDDYHTEHGEGHDFYSVGLTLGAGDIAPYEEGKVWYSGNYRRWRVLDNGPLRSCFVWSTIRGMFPEGKFPLLKPFQLMLVRN